MRPCCGVIAAAPCDGCCGAAAATIPPGPGRLHAGCRRGRWGLMGLDRAPGQTGRPDLPRSWRGGCPRGLVGLRQTGAVGRRLCLRGLLDLRLRGPLGPPNCRGGAGRLRALLRRSVASRDAFRRGELPLLSRDERLRRLRLRALRRRRRRALNAAGGCPFGGGPLPFCCGSIGLTTACASTIVPAPRGSLRGHGSRSGSNDRHHRTGEQRSARLLFHLGISERPGHMVLQSKR